MATERVTVTLPPELVREVDRRERNRSRFFQEAARRELERRRREELRHSIGNPHSEQRELAEIGFDEWAQRLPADDGDLLDPEAGTEARWTSGEGWREGEE